MMQPWETFTVQTDPRCSIRLRSDQLRYPAPLPGNRSVLVPRWAGERVLLPEMEDWMNEMIKGDWAFFPSGFVIFANPSDAMLFKLSWSTQKMIIWRLIDTAPKDGTRIWMTDGHNQILLCKWNQDDFLNPKGRWIDTNDYFDLEDPMSHWCHEDEINGPEHCACYMENRK